MEYALPIQAETYAFPIQADSITNFHILAGHPDLLEDLSSLKVDGQNIFNGLTESISSYKEQRPDASKQMKKDFNRLAKKWKRETFHLSSIQQIVLHPAYQAVIAMGPKVIPYILHELEREPAFWYWALRHLTRSNPVTAEMRGNVRAMTKAWLEWGRANDHLSS